MVLSKFIDIRGGNVAGKIFQVRKRVNIELYLIFLIAFIIQCGKQEFSLPYLKMLKTFPE